MRTRKRVRRYGGAVTTDFARSVAIGAVFEILEKASKQGSESLTVDETKQLKDYVAFLSNIKGENGKSVMAEAIREATAEIKSDKAKTSEDASKILVEEVKDVVKRTGGANEKGIGLDSVGIDLSDGVTRQEKSSWIPEGLNLANVLKVAAVGLLLYAGTVVRDVANEPYNTAVALRTGITNKQGVDTSPFCITYKPGVTPMYEYEGMADIDPMKSQDICLTAKQKSGTDLYQATREYYQYLDQNGIDPASIEGPPLQYDIDMADRLPVIEEGARGNQTMVDRSYTRPTVKPRFAPEPGVLEKMKASVVHSPAVEARRVYEASERGDADVRFNQEVARRAAEAADAAEEGGRRKQKRKTKKRAMKKRVTRRKSTFVY